MNSLLQQRNIPFLALFLGLVPIIVINLNYMIAAAEEFVPWCVPYWDSCTSISATGREGSAFFFFKLTMIPIAFVYLLYWRASNNWLIAWGHAGKTISTLGLIASLALLVYTIALGAVGDNFQLTRRIGIILFFTFTYLNQLLIIYRLFSLEIPDPAKHMQLSLSLITLGIGILTLILDAVLFNYDDYEDAFEWILALLLHINFVIAYFGWKSTTQVASE
ncbi:MAG: hypothetical protein GKR91_03965 [Pseudomonadales bacterium]|nr:hypothetical protein [Pseudomonadales bacterium]